MRDLVELRRFFRRVATDDLVLCTIVRKTGSSYRNPLAKKILSLHGQDSYGLLTGGCLEKEIEEIARGHSAEFPLVRSFSTASEEDRLMGYQKGCAGVIDVLFEKLPRDLSLIDLYLPFGDRPSASGVTISLDAKTLGLRKFATSNSTFSGEPVLLDPWILPIELTLVGCGADADPYLEFAETLGWNVRVVDYRSDLARPDRFPQNEAVQASLMSLDRIAGSIREGPRVAVVLMTHNFEADLNIFAGLIGKNIGYLGCVGPRKRYELLKQDLKMLFAKEPDDQWEERVVRAPPGITPANHSPAEIAFSIVADIQFKLGAGDEK